MLLYNCSVLHIGETDIFLSEEDIRFSGLTIEETGPHLTPKPGEESLDLGGGLVLPGMVNSHSHSYTNLLRGTSFGEPLELWSADTVALGAALTREDMALSTALGVCEMLRAGVTACVDHLPHLATADAAAKVYRDSGFFAVLAPMLHNVRDSEILCGLENSRPKGPAPFPSVTEYIDYYEDFIRRFHDPIGPLRVMAGVNSPQRADDSLLAAVSDLVSRHGVGVHCHLLETRWQKATAREDGTSPLVKLDRFGLLNRSTSLAHCVWMDSEELALMADRGAIAVSNPASNLFLGSGVFAAEKFRSLRIPVALGSDGVNCGVSHNMLEILRLFLLSERAFNPDYASWTGRAEAMRMLTVNGRRVLNADGRSGEINADPLSAGQPADIVAADRGGFLNIDENAVLNQLLFHNSLTVRHVWVRGRAAVTDGKITVIDEEGLKRELEERRPCLKNAFMRALEEAAPRKAPFSAAYRELSSKGGS